MRTIFILAAVAALVTSCTDKVSPCVRRCEARLGSYANAVCVDLCGNASSPEAMFQIGR